jgi:hypothetical protein
MLDTSNKPRDAITLLNASGYAHVESLQFVEQHKPGQLAWNKRLCYCCCFVLVIEQPTQHSDFLSDYKVLFCTDIPFFT